jgi:hypothetical protein
MALAYRKGSKNEADPLSRRADFKSQPCLALFGDGEVPQSLNSRVMSQSFKRDDAPFTLLTLDVNVNSLIVYDLQLYMEIGAQVRLGYTTYSFYGEEGEWTKGGQLVAKDNYFLRHDRLCIAADSEF